MVVANSLALGLEEVDIIIAGGGTAGCVVAGRLATADPTLSILVIEGGNNSLEDPTIRNPGVALHHLRPDSKTAIFYQAEEAEELAGRGPVVPSGGVLGGGSAINFMMYTRAQACDFDSWKTPGWTAEDMKPFLRKLEKYHGPGSAETHGFDGPIEISKGGFCSQLSQEDFIQAAAGVGYPEVRDLQDLTSCNGVSRWLSYISPTGMRQDTAHVYLQRSVALGPKSNVEVLVQHNVIRVLFDDQKKANGVELIRNTRVHPDTKIIRSNKRVVRARKMVIISCGACGTPSVLERSGIGRTDILHKASIPVVAEVRGVGQNYQDHTGIFPAYKTNLNADQTNNALITDHICLEQAIRENDPKVHWNTVDVAAKIRPTESEVAELDRPFRAAWEKDFKDEPSKPLMLLAFIPGYTGNYIEERLSFEQRENLVCVASYSAYPYSRGSIHITGPSMEDAPRFKTGYFSDTNDFDLKAHIWSYKRQREIMRRTKMFRGEWAISHPKFPPGSKAGLLEDFQPVESGAYDILDIEYSAEDNKAIEGYLRENVNTTWHSLGTAKMAPQEKGGVVDKDLNVYGVQGLKVVDLSIAPENVGANTNNTAIAIGEKGADIIARELGLTNWS